MTEKQFLAKLAKSPRNWELADYFGKRILIRRKRPTGGECCPITALVRRKVDSYTYMTIAKEIGLERGLAERIAEAADGLVGKDRKRKRLRTKLLKACGLS